MRRVDCDEENSSFEELYNKYYLPIYNYIFHQTSNKETTEDLTSITFLKALRFINDKNPKIDNFHAWIYKIATNEILIYKNNNKRVSNAPVEDSIERLQEFLSDPNDKSIEKYGNYVILNDEIQKMNDNKRYY